MGYRSIDTAAAYKNEEGVGKALKMPQSTEKNCSSPLSCGTTTTSAPRSPARQPEKLQLDYIDLYLMHWPVPAIDHYVEAWKGMIELQKRD